MLLQKRRKIKDGNIVKLSCSYDNFFYRCTFNSTDGEYLTIDVQIPKGFNSDSSIFSNFEELLLRFYAISSLELILQQLKLIVWESISLAESPRIEICAFKKVHDRDVLYLKVLEIDGKIMQYIQPTDYCIMAVYPDKSWECYDEELNFQLWSDGTDNIETICDTDIVKTRVSIRIPIFKNLAEKMYKQRFY